MFASKEAACRVSLLLCTDRRLCCPVSRVTENCDIGVVFLTLLGSKAVVVLSGVRALLPISCLSGALTVRPYLFVVGKPQVCYTKGWLMKFKKKVLFSINGLF